VDVRLGDVDVRLGDVDVRLGDVDVRLGDVDVRDVPKRVFDVLPEERGLDRELEREREVERVEKDKGGAPDSEAVEVAER